MSSVKRLPTIVKRAKAAAQRAKRRMNQAITDVHVTDVVSPMRN